MKKLLRLSLAALLLLPTFSACTGSKHLQKPNKAYTNNNTKAPDEATVRTAAFIKKVAENAQTAPNVTASASVTLTQNGKELSCSGKLRMRRGVVIQLSLSMLFMEVARIEFSPTGVLFIDRYHKEYVQASYDEVAFLKAAELDFNALQALFWNELFVPGESSPQKHASRFAMSESGAHTLLALTDAPKLNYDFLALTDSHLIDRLGIEGKTAGNGAHFTWVYADFVKLSGKPFPRTMNMTVKGGNADLGLNLELSNLNNDAKWEAHTTPSDKYKRRSAESMLKSLF